MLMRAEQLWLVATVYAKVAADKISVPSPQRAAFARKAERLRTLARIAAKIEACGATKATLPSHQENASVTRNFVWPQVKHRTLAERLEMARATAASADADENIAPSNACLRQSLL
jgi:hypothetical protein